MKSGIDFASISSNADTNEEQTSIVLGNENKEFIHNSISVSKSKHNVALSTYVAINTVELSEKKIEDDNALLHQLEETSKEKINGSLLGNYLKSAERPFMLAFLLSSFLLTQILASGADVFVPYW